jgi:hypothetical protein
MINGIVANVPYVASEIPAGTGPGEALLDFVAGTYIVDGVTVTRGDIFASASFNDAPTPADYFTERGFATFWRTGADFADFYATGPLATLLLSAADKTIIVEWENQQTYPTVVFGTSDPGGPYWRLEDTGGGRLKAIGFFFWYESPFMEVYGELENNIDGIYEFPSTYGDYTAFHEYGLNRLAVRVGAVSQVSINGSEPEVAVDMSSGFTGDDPLDQAWPLGTAYHYSTYDGYVRKIIVTSAASPTALQVFSTVSGRPAKVTGLSYSFLNGTSITLTHDNATGATGYEYYLRQITGSVSADDRPGYNPETSWNAWTTLEESKVITGLTPVEDYVLILRATSAAGPGGGMEITFTTTT